MSDWKNLNNKDFTFTNAQMPSKQVKSNEKKRARQKEKFYKKIKFADGRIALGL